MGTSRVNQRTAIPEIGAARIADAGEGVTTDELRLAARNHGMPSEALRYDVTPTGLHYVLTHYDIPAIDVDQWKLAIDGAVARPVSFDLASLRRQPSRTVRVTMECAGNGRAHLDPRPISQPWLTDAVGTADWTGVSLATLLDEAGVADDAVDVVFTGADHGFERGVEQDYQRGLSLSDARADGVLVAHLMNNEPLPVQHGFPVRLIVPGWYGMAHVKWLVSITVATEPFKGFQNHVAYRVRKSQGELGAAVTRIEPRASLTPPGVPDFMTRTRFVKAGTVELAGRAWSGWAPIARVEVTTDGGVTWRDAEVSAGRGASSLAWRAFALEWIAEPGAHLVLARATDETGRAQPLVSDWNRGGFANNAVQQIQVVVTE